MQVDAKQRLESYLSAISPLQRQELDAIIPLVQISHFKQGKTYLRMGESAERLGIVLQGVFRVFYSTGDGGLHVRRFCPEGRVVGDWAMTLMAKPARVTIEALEASEVAVIHYKDLEQLYDTYPAWQRLGRKLMEHYYTILEEREYQFLTLSAKERYQRFRIEYPGLEDRISQSQIASYLGINPVSLSRIRSSKASPRKP